MLRPRLRIFPLVLATAVSLAACSAAGSENPAPAQTASGDRLSLAGVCPNKIVVQTGWYPQIERGAVYQLVGSDPKMDANKKRVSGKLVAEGRDTGVQIEVRAGGPAIGFQPVSAQMYVDKSIVLGDMSTDESVQNSVKQPTLAVVAPLEIDPQVVLWDPATYPNFNTVVDIGQTDTTVLYFQGSTPMEYLVGSGILRKSQVDGSYDGSPSRFVAAGGKIAQMAFATNEPYLLEHEVKAWGKPVQFQLLYDTGYPIYPRTTLAIRAGEKQQLSPCLQKLVPIIQRAQVEFMADPKPTTDLILKLVDAYGSGFVYSRGLANYGVEQLRLLGLVGNGSNRTLGDFDVNRVQKVIDIVQPIFTAQRQAIKPSIKPDDIVTNDFIDSLIGLPGHR
jgi:hypothetical protein